MKKGLIEVSLLTIGICLSLITNLFTSDDSVLGFYNENRSAIIIFGVCLILLSVILAYNSAKSSDSGTKNSTPVHKSILRLLTNLLTNMTAVILLALVLNWGLVKFFEIELSILKIVIPVFAGVIMGEQFKYITKDSASGMLLGGFLGYAITFYFKGDLLSNLDLPPFVTEPVLTSTLVASAITLITTPFEREYKEAAVIDREATKKLERNNLSRFDEILTLAKKKGLVLYANNLEGRLLRYYENYLSDKLETARNEGSTEEEKEISVRELVEESRSKLMSDPRLAFFYETFIQENTNEVPPPP